MKQMTNREESYVSILVNLKTYLFIGRSFALVGNKDSGVLK